MTSDNSIRSLKQDEKISICSANEFSASEKDISRIHTSGAGNEFVTIGNTKYYKHELMAAFGGTLNPGYAPPPVHQFANAAALGVVSFAMTTFILSLYNAQVMGITVPTAVISLGCFHGGAVQFLAGVWEMCIGNTFAGTALTSYGAFWISYSVIFIEAFGIVAAYEDEVELNNAIGFVLLGWAIFTFMLTLCTLKSTVAFCTLFILITILFLVLAAAQFTGSTKTTRAGGVIGIITALLGMYNAFAGVANKQNSYFTAVVFPLAK